MHSLTSWQCIAADLEDAFPGGCAARSGTVRRSWIRGAGGVPFGEHVRITAQRMFELRFREPPARTREQRNVTRVGCGYVYIYIIIFRVNIRISRKEERGEEKNIEAHSVRRKKSTSAQNKSGRRKVSTGEKRVFGKEAKGARSRCGSIARYFRGSFILTNGAFGWRMVKPRGEIRPAQTCTRV